MEGTIFWLIPVALTILLVLLLLRHQREFVKPPIIAVEPLGLLVKRWRLVRFIGPEGQLQKYLSLTHRTSCHNGTALEQVLEGLQGLDQARLKAELIRCQKIAYFGEQRILETDGQFLSLLVGSLEEVMPNCKYSGDGKSVMKVEERSEISQVVTNAGKHGYLPLIIANKTLHGTVVTEKNNHTYCGIILLEPELSATEMSKVSKLPKEKVKFLSVLPEEFLQWLMSKIRNNDQFLGVGGGKSDHPREKEEYWDKGTLFGGADLKERYSIIRHWQHRYTCRVYSALSEDLELPVSPITQI